MKKILIAIPTSRYIENHTFQSVYDLTVPDGNKTELSIVQGYAVHQARNILVNNAIEKHCDYIFFVDGDVILPKDILKGLIDDDKDIICGYYLKKIEEQRICELCGNNPSDPNSEVTPNIVETDLPATTGVYGIRACGFGCTLIKVDVFKKMLEAEPDKLCFDYVWQKGRVISEDFLFCKRAEALGYKIFVDTRYKCGHIGLKVF